MGTLMQMVGYGPQSPYLTPALGSTATFISNVQTKVTEVTTLPEIINRRIVGDSECPVNLCEIKEGEEYITCGTCNKNFLTKFTVDHIKERHNCPHCKTEWKYKDLVIYKNT